MIRQWINRMAWKVVRATASPKKERRVCVSCHKTHRTADAYAACYNRGMEYEVRAMERYTARQGRLTGKGR